MASRFLHSSDPSIRRMSAAVYSVATGIAVLAWAAWGGLDEFRSGRLLHVLWLALDALLVWFVVAGLGLRAVRRRDGVGARLAQPPD